MKGETGDTYTGYAHYCTVAEHCDFRNAVFCLLTIRGAAACRLVEMCLHNCWHAEELLVGNHRPQRQSPNDCIQGMPHCCLKVASKNNTECTTSVNNVHAVQPVLFGHTCKITFGCIKQKPCMPPESETQQRMGDSHLKQRGHSHQPYLCQLAVSPCLSSIAASARSGSTNAGWFAL